MGYSRSVHQGGHMENDVTMTRRIPADKETVFKYWIQPRLAEKWSAPKGMTLKIPFYEAKTGGKYRYEHTDKQGTWVCDGQIRELVPNERLKLMDTVKYPDGKLMVENLPAEVVFREVPGGTEVSVFQGPFQDEEAREGCEQGWRECLDQLVELVGSQSEKRQRPDSTLEQEFY